MRTLLSCLLISWLPFFPVYGNPGDSLTVTPRPAEVKPGKGVFLISSSTLLQTGANDQEAARIGQFLAQAVRGNGGPDLALAQGGTVGPGSSVIRLKINPNMKLPEEGYELSVTTGGITLLSKTPAGLFRGVQTLSQMLPGIPGQVTDAAMEIPCVRIRDYPRFPYRGMHLDVSRHFFPKEFILRYIDLLAHYRMNTFHWHLCDDNGWRIEIKKYPELTKISAWRVDHEDKPWTERPAALPGEKATYGGFYTQEDIREVVKYAADRFITVIPEIEMPAHAVEVLAAYPRLSCTGGPFAVPTGSYWPNNDIYCAGNDSVFTFLEDVLKEVMDLFPSKYIHIGGDEADKTNWKKCPKCQARMTSEGLKDEKELQSYFMRRIEKFIVGQGRKVIGWDEILEGGLGPEATVMSWRGVEGGIAAARQGHDAIMTPTSYCYLDYYQADKSFEPPAIGGFVPLKKVYSYEPVPEELTSMEAKHILGVQGNLWTEWIPTASHAEYMVLPRMIALAEVGWSSRATRNWSDFRRRMERQYDWLSGSGYRFSRGSFHVEVSTQFNRKKGVAELVLSSEQGTMPIRYTLNGNDVTPTSSVYTGPVELTGNCLIRAGLFDEGVLKERITELPFLFHKGIGAPVKYQSPYSGRYPAAGEQSLTDGLRGSVNHRDGLWQGFLGSDFDVVIDLGREQPVNSVQMNFLQNQKSWIFLPVVVEYSLSSDGKKYHSFNEVLNRISPKEEQAFIQPFNFQFMAGTKARYVRVKAKNLGKCPSWHDGAGEPCWLFTDEIVVF